MFTGKIKIHVLKATNLKEPPHIRVFNDGNTQLNPYLAVEIKRFSVSEEVDTTSIKYGTLDPVWQEDLYIEDYDGIEDLDFSVKHKSVDNLDDDIGFCTINLPTLMNPDCSVNDRVQSFRLKEALEPQGTLHLNIKLELVVKERKLQRKKAFHKNIHYHNGHKFVANTFTEPTFCSQCTNFLWGLRNQGYICLNCQMPVHKDHYKRVIHPCTGTRMPNVESKTNYRFYFNIPHSFKDKVFLLSKCHHCGRPLVGQGEKCTVCCKVAHHHCVSRFPNDCGIPNDDVALAIEKLNITLESYNPQVEAENQFRASAEPPQEEELPEETPEEKLFKDRIRSSNLLNDQATTKPTLKDFDLLSVLGRGAFGKVFKAKFKADGQLFALKAMEKDVVIGGDDVDIILQEKEILTLGTKGNFMTRLHSAFQTKTHLFLVMELVSGGDLFFHLEREKRFSEEKTRFYAAEIVLSLKFLHKNGIIHRDIKLDNVLIDEEGHVKVADFGMCKAGMYPGKATDTLCGTPDYIAPEVLSGMKYGASCDWWALGILIYEMLTGRSPFEAANEDQIFLNIQNMEPVIPRQLSSSAKGILGHLLQKDPNERLGTADEDDINKHEFFASIDWDKLKNREVTPPLIPSKNVDNVDAEFRSAKPQLSVVKEELGMANGNNEDTFEGFSFFNRHFD